MKKGAENKVKLGRRPRAGEAASEWLRARITPGEAAHLDAVAKLLGRSSSEAARLACALLHAALFFRAPEQVAAVLGVEPVAGALSWAAVMVLAMIAAAKCPAVSVATKAEHAAIVELVGLGLVELLGEAASLTGEGAKLLGVELAKSAALRENLELWTEVPGAASMIVERKEGPALLTLAPPAKKGKPASSAPVSSSAKGPFRISVVSCSARKLDHMAPARELYSSDLFRKSLAFAEASADLVVIASAKLGLVMPDDLIEPYDLRLASLSEAERAVWAERVVWVLASMLSKSQAARGVELQILAGYAYAEPLRVAAEARGWVCRFPLAGLGIGARRRWLKVSLARLAGPAASAALGELGAARGALVVAAGELSASVKAPRRRRASSSSASSSSASVISSSAPPHQVAAVVPCRLCEGKGCDHCIGGFARKLCGDHDPPQALPGCDCIVSASRAAASMLEPAASSAPVPPRAASSAPVPPRAARVARELVAGDCLCCTLEPKARGADDLCEKCAGCVRWLLRTIEAGEVSEAALLNHPSAERGPQFIRFALGYLRAGLRFAVSSGAGAWRLTHEGLKALGELEAAAESAAKPPRPAKRGARASSSSASVKRSALLPAGYKGPAPASPAEASADWWAKSSSLPKGWDDLIAGEVFADAWDGNACGWLSPRNVRGCANELAKLLPIASLAKLRGPVWAQSGETCVVVAGALLVREGRAVRKGGGLVAPG